MNLLQAYFTGSILNPENKKGLDYARLQLDPIKQEKLEKRHDKNNRVRHTGVAYVPNIFNHIVEETKELKEALLKGDFDNALEEAADIINCAEILVAALYLSNQDVEMGKGGF